MSALSNMWQQTCSRLNVKPKQFAIMLVITVTAIGVLGVKTFVLKPKSASAQSTKSAAPGKAAKASPTAKGKPGDAAAANASPAPAMRIDRLDVVPVAFNSRPARDPFAPFFVYSPEQGSDDEDAPYDPEGGTVINFGAAGSNPKSGASGTTKTGTGSKSSRTSKREPPPPPEGPQGVALKAVIGGHIAVLNTSNVAAGDFFYDTIGQKFVVRSVTDEGVVLWDGTKEYDVRYAEASLIGNPGKRGGSSRPSSPKR